MSHDEDYVSDRAPEPVGAFPHAKRVGNLLFLSGIGPRTRGTREIPGNIEAQCFPIAHHHLEPIPRRRAAQEVTLQAHTVDGCACFDQSACHQTALTEIGSSITVAERGFLLI